MEEEIKHRKNGTELSWGEKKSHAKKTRKNGSVEERDDGISEESDIRMKLDLYNGRKEAEMRNSNIQ
jgi:hypothetical protein